MLFILKMKVQNNSLKTMFHYKKKEFLVKEHKIRKRELHVWMSHSTVCNTTSLLTRLVSH